VPLRLKGSSAHVARFALPPKPVVDMAERNCDLWVCMDCFELRISVTTYLVEVAYGEE